MRKTLLLTLVAVLGLALCAAAATPVRVSPTDPGAGPGASAAIPRLSAVAGVAGATDVKNLTTGLYFSTIQEAIDDAGTAAGDVLEVQVASHAEGICTVSKAVTIRGGGGGAIITSTTDTGTSGDARAWFLITVAGVTVQDLTFDGSANLIAQALRFKEAGAVANCTIQHIKRTVAEYTGVGIVGYGSLTVTGCAFSDCGRIGVILFGPAVTAGVVSGCTYTGKGAGDWLDYGIELGGGAVATLTNNTITGCTGVALVDSSGSAGVLITTYFGAGTTGTLSGNSVTGNSVGIYVGYDAADVSVVAAHSNDLSNNPDAAVANVSSTVTVDASANWWGANTATGVAAVLYGTVDYTPWLAVDTDTSADPGFQGDFSTLWVDDAGAQTGTVGRIQEAINLVSGSTVHVAAGLYDERININKPMSLLGATYGVSKRGYTVPSGYAYDTATESVIRPSTPLELQVVKVAADAVVFDGFVVANEVCQTGGVYQDLVGIDAGMTATTGIQVLNCVLGPNTNAAAQDGTMGRSGITVYGPRALPLKLVVMHDRIFDSKGNGCGIMIVGPYGPSYYGGVPHVNQFAGSVIEDNDILGNHRTGIELAGGVQGGIAWDDHVIIRDNLIAQNGWFALADKDNLKYGHGVMFIRCNGDKATLDGAGARYVRFEDNVVRDNEKSGLYIGPKNSDLFGTGNVVQDNGKGTDGYSLWDGVRVDLAELYYGGAALPVYDFLTNVSFTTGQFLANGAQGVNVMQTPTLGPIDVTCDWWGDALGPDVVPGNPSPGDGITGLATYAPWWTTATGPCDGFVPHVDPVTAGLCISTAHPCVTVPVTFTRAEATAARGISVTFQLGGGLTLCGTPAASILKGTWLTGFDAQYGIIDNGGGSYTVDQAINGEPCGITTGGQLFTLALTGSSDGVGTVTITDVAVRDCDNAPLPGVAGAVGEVAINVSVPTAISALAATQVKLGNDADGTTKIEVSWPAVEAGAEVVVYRANYGNYPEYDDPPGTGAVPAMPVTYPPTAPWVHAADVASGTTLTDQVAWPDRGFWYYIAYVKDDCDNVSAISNMTGGTLNYHLGDVMAGVTVCAGNNVVDMPDISLLGGHYGVAEGNALYLACLDVGPTTNRSVNARPTTDNKINFEDMMMFAINYGTVHVTTPQVAAVAGDAVWVEAPAKVTAGQTFTASLRLSGSGSLLGLSASLGWDRAVAEPVSVEAGELVTSQGGLVLSGGGGLVDCALLGADRRLVGEGDLARVTFRALANGAPQVAVAAVDARDAANRTVELTGTPPTVVPAATSFAPAMPNPFRGTTTLSYALAKGGAVELAVYGVDGRKVATLASGVQEAGSYRLTWDGGNARPGLYYARLTTPQGKFTRTLVLVK